MSREQPRRPIRRFWDEALEHYRTPSPEDIGRFLDDCRKSHAAANTRSRLIGLKVPESLLAAFRTKARLHGVPYQTRIENPMRAGSPTDGLRRVVRRPDRLPCVDRVENGARQEGKRRAPEGFVRDVARHDPVVLAHPLDHQFFD